MKRLVWIRTSPPDVPGSMAAYDRLARLAVGPLATGWELSICDLFDPRGGSSMWRHHLWRLRKADCALAAHPADLYHWLDGSMAAFIPAALRKRSLVTVHDLIPVLQLRGELSGNPSWLAAHLIRRGIRALGECAGLCADSRATKADLVRLAGIAVDAEVVPVPVRPLPPPAVISISGLGPAARVILHVGNNAAYKNRLGVLDVFFRLRDLGDVHLVMAGPPPTGALRAAARRLDRVHFVGPVDDAQLNGLYRRAAVFLFPSLYEGYGMPVLEAMASGCPVVCSTAPSLVEVAGDAARFASASNSDALAAHCRTLLADDALRQQLVAAGRARAACFDVALMGRSLMKWYEQALAALEKKESHG